MNGTREKETWCGRAAVQAAARACERRKRARPDCIAFRMREGEEVFALAERLMGGTYRPEPGRVFVTERPKHREVHAAAYRDRVVHHLIHALLEPVFEPAMSEASFACRRGRGTHAARPTAAHSPRLPRRRCKRNPFSAQIHHRRTMRSVSTRLNSVFIANAMAVLARSRYAAVKRSLMSLRN